MKSNNEVAVLCSSHLVAADGKSHIDVELRYSCIESGMVDVRLRGRGSLDSSKLVRQASVGITNGVGRFVVHAPQRPGVAIVSGSGFSQNLRFFPATIWQGLVFGWLPTLALALLIALLIRTYAFAGYYIPSASMEDTLMIGDVFIAESFTFRVLQTPPKRGDIVLLRDPAQHEHSPLIKRIIGLPGETITINNGRVFVDGKPLLESYLPEVPLGSFGPVNIAKKHYFLMGDNRNHSFDSRAWGCAPREGLVGRAVVVVWPLSHIQLLGSETYKYSQDD